MYNEDVTNNEYKARKENNEKQKMRKEHSVEEIEQALGIIEILAKKEGLLNEDGSVADLTEEEKDRRNANVIADFMALQYMALEEGKSK